MSKSDLARAGEILKRHVHAPEPSVSTAVARMRLLDALQGRRQHAKRLALAALATAALAVVVGVLVLRAPTGAPVAFQVGEDRTPGQVGAYVTPSANEPLVLRFSEGSVIELAPATRARVTHTSPQGAVVLVETGRARVDVVHRPDTDWQLLAGPYTIQVQGTSFDVAFDAAEQTLEVVMRAGVVSVAGPGIATPVEIRGAQRFVHSIASASPRAPSASAAPPPPPAATDGGEPPSSAEPQSAADRNLARADAAGGARPTDGATADAGPPESWAAMVARGEYRRVLESAERQGLAQALSNAGLDDLMALGNAARFSGRTAVATQAYQAARARFAGSPRAASAAFLLGRMTEAGDPAGAITWYDRYVAEAPAGSFVAEALGRKMVVLRRIGKVDAAEAAARGYLKRFPGGPYAGVAREMTTP